MSHPSQEEGAGLGTEAHRAPLGDSAEQELLQLGLEFGLGGLVDLLALELGLDLALAVEIVHLALVELGDEGGDHLLLRTGHLAATLETAHGDDRRVDQAPGRVHRLLGELVELRCRLVALLIADTAPSEPVGEAVRRDRELALGGGEADELPAGRGAGGDGNGNGNVGAGGDGHGVLQRLDVEGFVVCKPARRTHPRLVCFLIPVTSRDGSVIGWPFGVPRSAEETSEL